MAMTAGSSSPGATDKSHSACGVILDLSRLVYAAWSRTPTGIPRVELAYAEHFCDGSDTNIHFVVLDAFGRLNVLGHKAAVLFVREIARYWREDVASDWTYWRLVVRAVVLHVLLLVNFWGSLERLIQRSSSRFFYIIPSQLHLERRRIIERLKSTGRVSLVYFVHDILPALFPEYFEPGFEKRTRDRMETAVQLADVILVNSQATADAFRAEFDGDRRAARTIVTPLGMSLPSSTTAPVPWSRPYFVMVGTLEPRKNHLLILNLWRRLSEKLGADTPRLVLIGCRGWENENVVDVLERSRQLRGIVEERSRLSDYDMLKIIKEARALLLPSFAEGYGLPLAESLAAGVPVICSDIQVFHEVGGTVPEFIDPLDGPGWLAAIEDYLQPESPRRQAQLTRLNYWRAPTWQEHFERLHIVVNDLRENSRY